ncbi:MAG TPA: tRNA adenosine deaminase-associated protein [Mycobacteriales bacterium]|nr:tRNA adenosine deaminase-associated protein [Mycobacteriales bacterium]
MTYVASTFARVDSAWFGDDVSLDEVEDLDGVVELVREVIGDEADTGLLFVEQDDEWFAVLRLDADGDPRVFVSDARAVGSSDIASALAEGAIEVGVATDDDDKDDEDDVADDEDSTALADGDPAGDAGLLSDLGTSASRLLALCAEEGALPADIIAAVCESAGCLDVLEKLRGE